MKTFVGFIKKEFLHIFRDARSMMFLFGMPIAQILIFGFVVTNEIKDVKIAVLDKSNDAVTHEIINKITSSGFFILVKNLKSETEIEEEFHKGTIKEVIIFESSFASNLTKQKKANIQIIADASDLNIANMITNYTSGIIQTYTMQKNAAVKLPMQIDTRTRMQFNESLKSAFMFVPGTIALILMLISAMMTSISITKEKEMGTMEVLLISPLKPVVIIAGKVIPYIAVSFLSSVVILILGYFVFNVPVQGSTILLLGECLLFILMALSLGILISTVAPNQMVAMFMSAFALMLPTMLLSGFIFPIESMPIVMQWICNIMPPKYFIIIMKNIMIKGTGFSFVWKETLILLGFTLFFLALSIKKFKLRLE